MRPGKVLNLRNTADQRRRLRLVRSGQVLHLRFGAGQRKRLRCLRGWQIFARRRGPGEGGVCEACAPGKYSISGTQQTSADVCVSCGPGRYSISGSGQTNESVCIPCSSGRYSSSGLAQIEPSVCVSCEVGTYQGELGKTSCADCPRGFVSAPDVRHHCRTCPHGRFQPSVGSLGSTEGCKACSAGKFRWAGACGHCANLHGDTGASRRLNCQSDSQCLWVQLGDVEESGQCLPSDAGLRALCRTSPASDGSDVAAGWSSTVANSLIPMSPNNCEDCVEGTVGIERAFSRTILG